MRFLHTQWCNQCMAKQACWLEKEQVETEKEGHRKEATTFLGMGMLVDRKT